MVSLWANSAGESAFTDAGTGGEGDTRSLRNDGPAWCWNVLAESAGDIGESVMSSLRTAP